MTSRDERAACEHFRQRYAAPATNVTDQIEASVIGAVGGVNGYTTVDQADELARRLALGPERRVLDVGTGRGWPGVYFATRYGCDVIGTDMPFDALARASSRAVAERVDRTFTAVAAAGAHQPFRAGSFDAIVHTDVLC
jgi:2-polyprenyl-3-methyl-5-hydroxy-6-metoxy-1,4-benzoquinol methylase